MDGVCTQGASPVPSHLYGIPIQIDCASPDLAAASHLIGSCGLANAVTADAMARLPASLRTAVAVADPLLFTVRGGESRVTEWGVRSVTFEV